MINLLEVSIEFYGVFLDTRLSVGFDPDEWSMYCMGQEL